MIELIYFDLQKNKKDIHVFSSGEDMQDWINSNKDNIKVLDVKMI